MHRIKDQIGLQAGYHGRCANPFAAEQRRTARARTGSVYGAYLCARRCNGVLPIRGIRGRLRPSTRWVDCERQEEANPIPAMSVLELQARLLHLTSQREALELALVAAEERERAGGGLRCA